MQKKLQTINTYNKSAQKLAKKYDNLGPRIPVIDEMFSIVTKTNPFFLEIGCGNGRDAKKIVERTTKYLGIDISEELVKLAREKVPQADFQVVDVTNFNFPDNLDIVYASASLIHVQKHELELILRKIYKFLNKGGIVRMSLKYSRVYKEVTLEDEFGVRTYYHYSEKDIKDLAGSFLITKLEVVNIRNQDWIEVCLQK